MNLFRELNSQEKLEFRQWARDNYGAFDPINEVWHPVVQDECRKINEKCLECDSSTMLKCTHN